jgi:hypothetical protein
MSGKITSEGFRIEGRTGLEVHLDNGETKPLSEFNTETALYKKFTALLNQSGTSAPTANILENTLGEVPTYGRTSSGVYTINTVSNMFYLNKTFFIVHGVSNRQYCILMYRLSDTQCVLYLQNISTGTGTDNVVSIDGASIEIRIYN